MSYYYDIDDSATDYDDNTTNSSDIIVDDDSSDNIYNSENSSIDEGRNRNNNTIPRSMFNDALRLSNHMFDEIFDKEETFIDSDKDNGQYLIGMTSLLDEIPEDDAYGSIVSSCVTAKTFFLYPYNTIRSYLILLAYAYPSSPNIDIIKLYHWNSSFGVIFVALIKTHWIRLIQRHWKKIYAQRCAILNKRASISVFLYFQIRGKYKNGMNSLPNIHGMLSPYNKKYIK